MKRSVLQAIRPLVKDYSATRGGINQSLNGNAVVGIIHKKPRGFRINRINYNSCYGSLYNYGSNTYSDGFRQDEIIGALLQIQPCKDDLNKDAYRHYIEWVLNYSPWRHAFITKSVSKALKEGVVLVDTEQNTDYMMGAMIGLRQAWENFSNNFNYKRVGLWWDIAQNVNPTIAFVVTNPFLTETVTRDVIRANLAGHTSLPFTTINEGFISFIRDKKKVGYDNPFSRVKTYSKYADGGLSSIWRGVDGPSITDFVTSTLKLSLGDKVKVNPFMKNNIATVYNRSSVIEAFVSSIPELERKIYA